MVSFFIFQKNNNSHFNRGVETWYSLHITDSKKIFFFYYYTFVRFWFYLIERVDSVLLFPLLFIRASRRPIAANNFPGRLTVFSQGIRGWGVCVRQHLLFADVRVRHSPRPVVEGKSAAGPGHPVFGYKQLRSRGLSSLCREKQSAHSLSHRHGAFW